MVTSLAVGLGQLLLMIILAPLLTGLIKKFKAFCQTRSGPRVFQQYFDLYKYVQKESVISEHTTWIFRVTPYIYFSAVVAAAGFVPIISTLGFFKFTGDLILIIYLFALARFFLTLAGLDAGSAFGGMASSREMAISSMAEPAMMLSLFTMSVVAGTTNLNGIITEFNRIGMSVDMPARLLAFVAFFIVAVAETGRIPVDNPDTHLELTMIHEGMLLEFSGKQLALLTLGASVKQLVILSILANLFFPWGITGVMGAGSLAAAVLAYLGKVALLGVAMAVIETSFAKMRLFKVPDLMVGSFLLGFLGLIVKFVFSK